MEPLLIKATLKSMKRVKDSSVNLSFSTMEEVSPEDFSIMDQYFQQNGWLAFKTNEVDMSDLPKENATVEGEQTPSQYLRRCLFSKHMNSGGTKDTFPQYYQKAMAGFAKAVNDSNPGSN